MSDIVVKIEVTAEDIRKGKRHRCGRCPMALALNRVCTLETFVGNPSFQIGDDYTGGMLPDEACLFISSFDSGFPVSPFSFPLSLPREYVRPEFWPAEVKP